MLHDNVQPCLSPVDDAVVVAHNERVPHLAEDVDLTDYAIYHTREAESILTGFARGWHGAHSLRWWCAMPTSLFVVPVRLKML